MDTLTPLRKRHIVLMKQTADILGHVLRPISQEQAAAFRDDDDGWSILEVMGHLRDFDGFFHARAVMMLNQDYPQLPAYDHEALVALHQYNAQNLNQVYDEFVRSRERFIAFFKSLDADQWEQAGVHPERGHFTMTDAVMQVGMHDVTHLEQITRIMARSGLILSSTV